MDDFFYKYNDGSNYGISPRGLVVTDDGAAIGVHASGFMANTPHIAALLAGGSNGTAQDWGESNSGASFVPWLGTLSTEG